MERCREVTEAALQLTFRELFNQKVLLEGMVLKPNMVLPGKKYSCQNSVQEVAEMTVKVLRRQVPGAVPGIAFLSGGQSEEEATAHLNAMNMLGPLPWELSFSYGRALQASALQAWRGNADNVPAAQAALAHRAKMNSLARSGDYQSKMEKGAA
jgi:fructose-bisphosphate aldolase class I